MRRRRYRELTRTLRVLRPSGKVPCAWPRKVSCAGKLRTRPREVSCAGTWELRTSPGGREVSRPSGAWDSGVAARAGSGVAARTGTWEAPRARTGEGPRGLARWKAAAPVAQTVRLGTPAARTRGPAVDREEGHLALPAHPAAALDFGSQHSEPVGIEPALLDEELGQSAILPLAKTLVSLQQQLLEMALFDYSLFKEQLPPELLANAVHQWTPQSSPQYGGGASGSQGERSQRT